MFVVAVTFFIFFLFFLVDTYFFEVLVHGFFVDSFGAYNEV